MYKHLLFVGSLLTTLLCELPIYTQETTSSLYQKNLQQYADSLVKDLTDHFEPQDLIFMAYRAAAFLETDTNLTLDEKRAGVVAILNQVIDQTDTPGLPDYLFDPLFKAILPPFITLMIQDNTLVSTEIPLYTTPAPKDSNAFANEMVKFYGNIYRPEQMPAYIQAIVAQSNRYKNLNREQKLQFANNAYHYFLQKTDIQQIPDLLVDPILRKLGNWMLKELIL